MADHFARLEGFKARQGAQQGALARAVCAQDSEDLSRLEVEAPNLEFEATDRGLPNDSQPPHTQRGTHRFSPY
jgi:hypothetical protein